MASSTSQQSHETGQLNDKLFTPAVWSIREYQSGSNRFKPMSLRFFIAITAICMLGSLRADPLMQHLWKRRVILSFSASQSTPERIFLLKQIAQYPCEFDDRQMVHVDLIAGSSDYKLLSNKFSVPKKDFNLVLLGKDGDVKLLTSQPSLETIWTLIDTMPMRQREMRTGSCR